MAGIGIREHAERELPQLVKIDREQRQDGAELDQDGESLAEILVLESNPEQYSLHIVGSLPNPCYKLRISLTPLQDGSINIEAYSLTERGSICIEVLQSFEATLPLNALPKGGHLILLNGEELGRITIR